MTTDTQLRADMTNLNKNFDEFKLETKADLTELKTKVDTIIGLGQDGHLRDELMKKDIAEIQSIQHKQQTDFEAYKSENRKEINGIKDSKSIMKWLMGIGLTASVLLNLFAIFELFVKK